MFDLAQSLIYGLGALLAAAAITAFTAWLQHRSWRHQQDVTTRKSLTDEALSLTKELSRLCNRRIYRQRQYLWRVRSGPPEALKKAREEYRDVLYDWNDNLGQIKAGIFVYFDLDLANKIENDIHDNLRTNGDRIEQSDRSQSSGSLAAQEIQLNEISYEIYQITSDMLNRIKAGDISDLQNRKIISHRNKEYISTYRLMLRLVNLSR